MPTREHRTTLKLVKGSGEGTPRRVARRAVVRRMTRAEDPVVLLERLDEQPVEEAGPPPAARSRRPRGRFAPMAGHRWRRPRRNTVLAAVVLALALAAAAVTGQRWYADRALERAHAQALAAAKQTSVNFVSVSASSVDRDLQRIVAGATGEFRDEFVRGQAKVRQAVVENDVRSTGSVLRAGLVSGDRRSAVVLVAVDATVRNVKAPDGRPSHYRIQVDVTRDPSGAWLVSRLQFVG